MIRTIITPETVQMNLPIPEALIGKRMAVLAFPLTVPSEDPFDLYRAGEQVLAADWLSEEEDLAWKDL